MFQIKRENIAIYGAGLAGIHLMDALRQSPYYSVKLFIDDNPDLDGKNLSGFNIINFKHLKESIRSIDIKTLFSATSLKTSVMRKNVFDMISDYPMKVKSIPNISSFIFGTLKVEQLKTIKIEKLLGREPVKPCNQF